MTTPAAPPRNPFAAIRQIPAWVPDALWLAILAAYLFGGLALIPLHGDETSFIWASQDWADLLLRPDLSHVLYNANRTDAIDRELQNERLATGPMHHYAIGLAWTLAGYRPGDLPPRDWDWNLTWDQNAAVGLLPGSGLILAARAASTAWLALGLIGLFWLGRTIGGRQLAYISTALFAIHPLILLHARRGMAEGALIGTTLLALAATSHYLMTPSLPSEAPAAAAQGREKGRGVRGEVLWLLLIGLLSGLSFSAKHNGALTVAIAAFIVAVHGAARGAGIRRVWEAAWRAGIVVASALAISFALAPAYWSDPVGAARTAWGLREFITGAHAWTWGGYQSPAERIGALYRVIFIPRRQYFDIPAWAAYLADDIRAYQASPFAGLPPSPLLDGVFGALFVLGAAAATVTLVTRRESRPLMALVLAWLLVTLAATYALIELEWHRYYTPIIPIVIFFQAYGLCWLIRRFVPRPSFPRPERWTVALSFLLGAAVLGAKLGLVDRIERPSRLMYFEAAPTPSVPLDITYGDQVTLAGIDLYGNSVRSGETLYVSLWWRLAGERIADEYATILSLHDAAGQPIAQADSGYDIPFQTSSWVPSAVIEERLALHVPPGTPPGDYSLHVSLFAPRSNTAPQAVAGGVVSVNPPIASVAITRPLRPADPASLDLAASFDQPIAPSLDLIGVTLEPAANDVGQPFHLTLGWRASDTPPYPISGGVHWFDAAGRSLGARTLYIPTDLWRAGDVWKTTHLLYVPGGLPGGSYRIWLGLVGPAGQRLGGGVDIGTMTVGAPTRTYDLPTPQHTSAVEWANGIRLLGYDLPDGPVYPGPVTVTLYWQPQEELNDNLTVFVHLIDAQGNIAAQRDQAPFGGARPTLGWAPGEVIGDALSMDIPADLPPGEYRLRIGWYNPVTGVRVPLADGGDFLILPESLRIGE